LFESYSVDVNNPSSVNQNVMGQLQIKSTDDPYLILLSVAPNQYFDSPQWVYTVIALVCLAVFLTALSICVWIHLPVIGFVIYFIYTTIQIQRFNERIKRIADHDKIELSEIAVNPYDN